VIEEIRIRALGVIDDAVMDFAEGFTVVTGETGAGKTMVVTGLGLLLGARADSAQVRGGAERASVEGRFRVDVGGAVAERIAAAGGALDDNVATIVRNVNGTGRSRAFVGGAGAPVSLLGELAERLVAVHGQSDQQRLLQPTEQRRLLDAFAENGRVLADYRRELKNVRAARAQLERLLGERQAREREADLLRFGLAEIAKVEPKPGEDATLRAEEARLAHAEELHDAATHARAALDHDDDPNVNALVGQARKVLDPAREHDTELASLADRLGEIAYLATDLAADFTSYADSVDVDPQRLSAVSERRAALSHLTQRYGSTVDEVLEWSANSRQRLDVLDSTDDDVRELEEQLDAGHQKLSVLAGKLSKSRTRAATKLSTAVTAELVDLAMPDATFEVSVAQAKGPADTAAGDTSVARFGDDGIDDVVFLLRAHVDAPPLVLAKGASGGELSRVMLALEVCLASVDTVPTFIFDEVDAGVGGQAAVEVGKRLSALAQRAQVIVVTHLPQVAVFADHHLVVTKSRDGAVTRSDVAGLNEDERPKELARMLAGLPDSTLGQAHAEELLDMAQQVKSNRS
jgi:DNA repair protein RecN (Recombination protein N)